MPQPDLPAATACPAGRNNCARGDRDDGGAGGSAVVDAEVRLSRVKHRVQAASRKARRDARLELQGRHEEEALQRSPGFIVIAGLAAGRIRPAEGLVFLSRRDESGAEDVAVSR